MSDHDAMQVALNAHYRAIWPGLAAALASGEGYSMPLLISVPERYAAAPLRLMVVGQETCGWGNGWGEIEVQDPEKAIQRALDEYKNFAFGRTYRSTPFWRMVRQLQARLAPLVPDEGFVWTNLFLVDHGKGQSPEAQLEAQRRLRSPPEQVRILAPHAVIFLSGPGYDYTLDAYFPGDPSPKGPPYWTRLSRPPLPPLAFRTYHPNYLLYRRSLDSVVDALADAILREV